MRFIQVSREALALGYRSGLEMDNAAMLEKEGVAFDYESHPLRYTIPARTTRYTFDFLLPNGIIIETKGRFVSSDRKKHKLIKEQFPNLDLRIVFSNPNQKIGKRSKTTYAMWCDSLDIPFAAKYIPEEWYKTRLTKARVKALEEALGYIPDIIGE